MRSPSALPPPEDGGGGGQGGERKGGEGGRLTNQMQGLNRRQGEKEETDKRSCGGVYVNRFTLAGSRRSSRAAQRMLINGKLMSI